MSATVSLVLEALVAFFLVAGGIFAFLGSLGLAKLPDFYMRLHGPGKASTLGLGCILVASAIYFSAHTGRLTLHEFMISIFLFMTAPITSHMLIKAALHWGLDDIGGVVAKRVNEVHGVDHSDGGVDPMPGGEPTA